MREECQHLLRHRGPTHASQTSGDAAYVPGIGAGGCKGAGGSGGERGQGPRETGPKRIGASGATFAQHVASGVNQSGFRFRSTAIEAEVEAQRRLQPPRRQAATIGSGCIGAIGGIVLQDRGRDPHENWGGLRSGQETVLGLAIQRAKDGERSGTRSKGDACQLTTWN